MTNLQLSRKEKAILVEIIDSALSDLRMEIADTERKEFRDELKVKETLLNKVLRALAG